MKCDSHASFSAYTFANPYLGCKLKAKVTTIMTFFLKGEHVSDQMR
jgi:hypothetical protein